MFKDKRAGKSTDQQATQPTYNTPQSTTDLRKTIHSLENMYNFQKQRRIQAQKHLLQHKQRSIIIQKQFHDIIERHKRIPYTEQNSKFHQQIQTIYKQILENFDQSNNATNAFIQSKYQNSAHFLDRRIDEISDHMKDQLKKHLKLSKDSYEKITKEIRLALEGALNVEDINIGLSKKIKEIEFNNKVLKQERALLINEILDKKQTIKELSQKLELFKQSQRTINELSRRQNESQIDFGGIMTPKTSIKFTTIRHQPSIKNKSTLKQTNERSISRRPRTPKTPSSTFFDPPLRNDCKRPNLHTEKIYDNRKKSENRKNKNSMTSFDIDHRVRNFRDSKFTSTISAAAFNSKQLKNCESSCQHTKQKYQQTIFHLNQALRRYKNRTYEMQKLMSSYQSKSKQINDALELAIKESYEKIGEQRYKESSGEGQSNAVGDRLEMIVKSEKLFETLKMLKRRLSMLEFPGASCGWGDLGNEN